MLAYRIDPAKIAGAMDAAVLESVVKNEFNKDGWAEAAMASVYLSTDDYHKAIEAFQKASKLGYTEKTCSLSSPTVSFTTPKAMSRLKTRLTPTGSLPRTSFIRSVIWA